MWERERAVDRRLRARRWIAATFFLAAAPLPPAGAWLLYSGQGPTPISLAITVAAGATAVLSFVAGIGAFHEARAAAVAARTWPSRRPAGSPQPRPPRLPQARSPRSARHRQEDDHLGWPAA